MKLHVKLAGIYRVNFPDYDPDRGMAVELPAEATVNDLLVHLGLADQGGSVVIMDKRVMKPGNRLKAGSRIAVFPIVQGG